MLFNSYAFMFFFPIVLVIYFIIPKRMRCIWLLMASYYFYMNWNPKYALLIAFSTIITYLSGIFLEKTKLIIEEHQKMLLQKAIVFFSFFVNIGILVFFKYFTFLLDNLNKTIEWLGGEGIVNGWDIILPVGISFYTFQALSYTVDVYKGKLHAEKNIFRYALFVSFFPQLVAGPIERSTNLLKQIERLEDIKVWDYNRIASGCILMLWGFFQKMVIADRVAILVDTVYSNIMIYNSYELLVAAIGFSIQIYCDFSSYSNIAVGAAKIMGLELMENFNTPYFANSIQDFWRRWHISLSTWFRDYLYIPLGGGKCSKVKKYRNIMVTFLMSGLWHGANWTYVIWGGLHGVYQIIGAELKPLKEKINRKAGTKTDTISYKLGKTFITFVLTTFAWIFFRADSIKDAIIYIKRIVTKFNPWALTNGTLYELGLDVFEMHILWVAVTGLVAIDLIRFKYKVQIDVFLKMQNIWFRWGIVFIMFWIILIFGIYGPSVNPQGFIYFQF